MAADFDHWSPHGPWGRHLDTAVTPRLRPGHLVVLYRQPHRVLDAPQPTPRNEWTQRFADKWMEHGMPDLDGWQFRPYTVVARHEDRPDSRPARVLGSVNLSWWLLPEHYSICRLCHELPPCTHVHNEQIMEEAGQRMERALAILPGSCHGCREPVTARQKSVTFPGPNLIRPDLGDNSAIFHTRKGCIDSLHLYDWRWAAAEEGRERMFASR